MWVGTKLAGGDGDKMMENIDDDDDDNKDIGVKLKSKVRI